MSGVFPCNESESCAQCGKGWDSFFSNEAGEPLLYKWSAKVGKRLLPSLADPVQRKVISRNTLKDSIYIMKVLRSKIGFLLERSTWMTKRDSGA